jgi:ATP-dependent helicase HrpB
VRIVVDSGLSRAARFDPRRGMSGLVTVPVSRAVADQRRGRAGRQAAGVCYRLWTESEHEQLPEYPVPEIRVSDLANVALDLALWGTPTGEGLSFLDPPPKPHLAQAQTVLRGLGAMTDDGKLTAHGRSMAALPIHPRLAHMIIKGNEMGRGPEACELAALLEERDILAGGTKSDVDLESRIEAFHQSRGAIAGARDRVALQKRRLMEMMEIRGGHGKAEKAGLLIALAYPERIARKRAERFGSYQLSNGTTATLPSGSLLARKEFLAIADVDAGAGDAKIFLAAPVSEEDLEDVFADTLVQEKEVGWSDSETKVVFRRVRKLGAVILTEQSIEPAGEEITGALIEGIRRTGLHCLPWDKEADRFRARVQWARRILPEASELPDFSDEGLNATMDQWLAPFLGGKWRLQHLQRLQLAEILRSRLSPRQAHELDRLAPSQLHVPSGSHVSLDYTPTDHPALSVKLQELFGLTETPRVGAGRIPVTIHLLSPAARPLGVTQDLRSFWENVYPDIRKQLRARYPKHPWPEDPLTATPTRRTIKKR